MSASAMPTSGPWVRPLALAYLALAVLAAAAALLPRLGSVTLAVTTILLALLPMIALWHRGAVRRLERLHRFAPERWLHRFGARRILGQVAGAVVALLLSAIVLLQSPWFGAVEWGLLALSPLVHLAWHRLAAAHVGALYSRPVYAAAAAGLVARWATFATLCALWLLTRLLAAPPATLPLAEVAFGLQTAWPDVASPTVRWAIDAGAWGQATLATLGGASSVPWWRAMLALLVLPATVFGHATWTAAGAALGTHDWRRVFGSTLSEADVPHAVAARRARAYVVGGVFLTVLAIGAFTAADRAMARQERWLALRAVPQCERIGGTAYAVGTLASLRSYTAVLEEGMAGRRATACERLAQVARIAAGNVDAYLDWYFSLGAEWMRLGLMLTGDVETLLEVKFNKLVASDVRMTPILAQLQADQQYLLDVAMAGRAGIGEVLARQRLVLDERQCRDVAPTAGAMPALPRFDDVRARLMASTAAGVAAGAFAGALTARAMSRATMQVAGRVLAKAAAKRGVSRIGSAAAGAATGAVAGSALPGIGTGIGAIAGVAAGLAVGASVDIAMLALEERLTRDDMRRDLLAAVDESLAPLRAAFECGKP